MWWILGLGALLLLLYPVLRTSGIGKATARAIRSGDIAPLVEQIGKVPEAARPTAFDQAVRTMWESYERSLAARLVRQCADVVADAKIMQYWIQQVVEVEPEISRRELDAEFLERYYHPEIAAQCGKKG